MNNNRGYTLIELILALVITGIIAAVAGLGIVNVVNALILTKQNVSTILKAQVAMTRIEREFHIIVSVTSGNSASFIYTNNKNGINQSHTLSYSGGAILLDGDTLVDNVSGFFSYRDTYNGSPSSTWLASSKVIDVTFVSSVGVNTTFTMRVRPIML